MSIDLSEVFSEVKDMKISEETISEILEPMIERDNLIKDKLDNNDFDLEKFFSEVMVIDGIISNEKIAYFPEQYNDLYEDMQLELDVICAYINKLYETNKMTNPPYYIDTHFGIDIYVKYNDKLYYYFIMHGQGTLEGISSYNFDDEVKYCINLDTEKVEQI
ncbi:hypothetical protein QOK74_08155 [Staphylococcus saprophyticus]|uniref:hypothetical protein n=1 Tax=Staphylococcus saprophyticus TaxID=29385 RepID=UPI0024C463B2|nr:hypothetical protein [Staphylococcus saprophyticus]MDK1672843.1 hypothetical protein [Staphylococcus saprophyticus]